MKISRKRAGRFRRARKRKGAILKRKTKRSRTLRQQTTTSLGRGFPKKIQMTHTYNEYTDISVALGVFTKYQWSCNGLYDPNITGGGHQPMYFDQVGAIYDHYTVIGSKITVTVFPTVSNTNAFYAGMYIDDDTTTTNVGSIGTLAEQTSGKWRVVMPGADSPARFTLKWSAKKMFGKGVLANNSLQGTTAGNPSEQSYFTLGLENTTSSTVTLRAHVQISYIVVWAEIKEIAPS